MDTLSTIYQVLYCPKCKIHYDLSSYDGLKCLVCRETLELKQGRFFKKTHIWEVGKEVKNGKQIQLHSQQESLPGL